MNCSISNIFSLYLPGYWNDPPIRFIQNEIFDVEITTQRLSIRPSEPSDLHNYAALFQDPDVVKFNCDGKPFSIDDVGDLLDRCQFINASPFGEYAIHLKNKEAFVGTFSIYPTKADALTIGLVLHKEFHGQKFGSEIAEAILSYIQALRKQGYLEQIKKVQATVHPDNIASWKIQEKMGLKCEGEVTVRKSTDPSITFRRLQYSIDLK